MSATDKLQVRLISPWQTYTETDTAVFSRDIPAENADALLCEWAPHPELFTFPRRRAWYCCEPKCQFIHMEGGTWPKLRARLAPHEFLWHGHPDERYRVPHITHFEPLVMNTNENRLNKAIAIVSNHGGSPWKRHSDITYRNHIITHPEVDLYGRSGWKRYRAYWYSRAAPPANYKGEIPGDWPAGEKRELMSKYRVAICMENMNEPYYFTEKFVEAVVAGCVPVYRANQAMVDGILKDAFWIDSSDYTHAPGKVIQVGLAASLSEVHIQNQRWLKENEFLKTSHASVVFERLGKILSYA